MIPACLMFIALALSQPSDCEAVSVRVLAAHADPTGGYTTPGAKLASTSRDGTLITFQPELAQWGWRWSRIALAHEWEHSVRLRAGTYDYADPWTEELIADVAARSRTSP